MAVGSRTELKPGDTFDGRFKIVEVLGRGNFSQVWRAKQVIHDLPLREVALKLFKEGHVSSDNVREVFNDAVTVFRLAAESPDRTIDNHIVHILDGGISRDTGRAYLTMELIKGGRLDKAIRQHSGLPGVGGVLLDLSLFYIQQILIPLAWMHSLDPAAVHGDLHPGNVLMTKTGELKVADFGLAAHLPLGAFGGAVDYQPPETLMNQPGDTRLDVYSLGVMWYEMLTGHSPFQDDALETLSLELHALGVELDGLRQAGQTAEAQTKLHEHDKKQRQFIQEHLARRKARIPPASETNEQLRDYLGLEDILNRCLAYWPNQRYASAAHVKKALDDYLAAHPEIPCPCPAQAEKEDLDQKPRLPELTPEMMLDQAFRLCERGEFNQALAKAAEVAAMSPPSYKAFLTKARIAVCAAKASSNDQRKQYIAMAHESVSQALRLVPNKREALKLQADVYRTDGRDKLAEAVEKMAASLRD